MSTIQDGFDLSNARGELAPESRLDIAVRAKKSVLLSDDTPKIRYETWICAKVKNFLESSTFLRVIENYDNSKI